MPLQHSLLAAVTRGVCCDAMRTLRLGVLFFLVAFALVSEAQQPFRAAISGQHVVGCNILPIAFQNLQWLGPDRVEQSTDARYIASDGNDRVFALLGGNLAAGMTIVHIEPNGARAPFYQDLTAFAQSFAVGRDGRVYVPLRTGGSFFLAVDRKSVV